MRQIPSLRRWQGRALQRSRPLAWFGVAQYLHYEQPLSLFCLDATDAIRLTAQRLGEALVAHNDFAWCRSTVSPMNPCKFTTANATFCCTWPHSSPTL